MRVRGGTFYIVDDKYVEGTEKMLEIARLSKGRLGIALAGIGVRARGKLGPPFFSVIDHERKREIIFGYVGKVLNFLYRDNLDIIGISQGKMEDFVPIGKADAPAWDDYQLILEKLTEYEFTLPKEKDPNIHILKSKKKGKGAKF